MGIMFEHITKQADSLRKLEKAILDDYRSGMSLEEIKIKHKQTMKFVKLTVKYYL